MKPISGNARLLRKARYVEAILSGMPAEEALAYAGYSLDMKNISVLNKDPWVMEKIQEVANLRVQKAAVTKEKVENIVLEAIDMARIKGDPDPMIRGASELSKMNGYYAPEKKQITVEERDLEVLSDAELLEMMGREQDVIEAEFERLEGRSE